MKGKSMIKDHNVVLEDSTLFHYTQYIYIINGAFERR